MSATPASSALYESSITSLPLLGRGKVRENYAVGDDKLLMVTTDRLSAFDVILGQPIPDKGRVLAQMSDLFERRILESLGLARRAGHLIIGFEKVAAALEEQKPGLLCLATDCSEDRCRVLSELVTKQKYMKLFQADRLGYALGRGKTTCVFVYHGHSRQRLENDIVRFQGIRPDMVRPISGNAERDTDVRGL